MNRALETIKCDLMKLCQVRLASAIEAEDWTAIGRLAEQLQDLAQRGAQHSANEKAKRMAGFAMGNHREPEPR